MTEINVKLLVIFTILGFILYLSFHSIVRTSRCACLISSKPLPLIKSRRDITLILRSEQLKTGAEIGVKYGDYSLHLLSNWPDCTEFHAIDLWAQQKYYSDRSNTPNSVQDKVFQTAQMKLAKYKQIIRYHRNFSHLAAHEIKNQSLDFIYLDARHDYVGVMEDLQNYWPKLKPGGIMAGHDYIDLDELRILDRKQDWGIDSRGIKRTDNKAVKSAVNDFARVKERQVLQTLRENWPTWYMRK